MLRVKNWGYICIAPSGLHAQKLFVIRGLHPCLEGIAPSGLGYAQRVEMHVPPKIDYVELTFQN